MKMFDFALVRMPIFTPICYPNLLPQCGASIRYTIWNPNLVPQLGTTTWYPNLIPRFGTPIWYHNFVPQLCTPTLYPNMVPNLESELGIPIMYPNYVPQLCTPIMYPNLIGSIFKIEISVNFKHEYSNITNIFGVKIHFFFIFAHCEVLSWCLLLLH